MKKVTKATKPTKPLTKLEKIAYAKSKATVFAENTLNTLNRLESELIDLQEAYEDMVYNFEVSNGLMVDLVGSDGGAWEYYLADLIDSFREATAALAKFKVLVEA